MVNKKIKPTNHNTGISKRMVPLSSVLIQEKILIPVGIAIIIVAAEK